METCISQEPKVIKNRNCYQMIAITIFYNYTIKMSADLVKGVFGHSSTFYAIKI